jgi:uncharacterized protein (TIGR03067 family)
MENGPMTPRRIPMVFTLAGLLVAGVSLRGAEDKIEGDLKKVQGKWTTPSGTGGTVKYTFEGRKLKVEAPNRSYEITVTLDASAKPEKTIDFKIDEAPEDARGKTSKGIYKFEGDKFVFCFSPEGDRPTEYKQVGYEKIVTELTRAKD